MPDISPELQKQIDAYTKTEEQQKAKDKPTAEPVHVAERVTKKYDMENNVFAQIVFADAEEITTEDKKDEVAKLLTYDLEQTPEENQERLNQFELFKEFLQSERKRMAQDIIELTDTETFAEMHEMFTQINAAICEFDDSMKPLTDILNAVYKLRQASPKQTLDIYKSFADDDKKKAEYDVEFKKQEAELTANIQRQKALELEIAKLNQDTVPLFSSKLKKSARMGLAEKEPKLEELKTLVADQTAKFVELKATPPVEQFSDLKDAKDKLRELLELSSPEHRERAKRLVAAAQNFVNTTDERGSAVLEHFIQERAHIDTLAEANDGLNGIYALLGESTVIASTANQAVHTTLATPAKGETATDRVVREKKSKAADLFIAESNNTAMNTQKVMGELVTQSLNITTMRNANIEQTDKAREVVTSGIASVAEGLAMTLSAVTAAATNESRIAAENALSIMRDNTDFTTQSEVLRQATGVGDQAEALTKAKKRLEGFLVTTTKANEFTREGLEKVKAASANMQAIAEQTKKSIAQLDAASAEADMQDTGVKKDFKKASEPAPVNDNKPKAEKPAKLESKIGDFGKGMGK